MLLSQQTLLPVAQGEASYYTVASTTPLTASGDRMDDTLYTCAMREGDFGGYYLVVAENGRSVVCKLNDRGPYIKGRIIDLSKAAMRKLHPRAGTLRVTVYKIDWPGLLPALEPGTA
jgi:rare lipoprotein A